MIRAAILGASGYSGAELLRILARRSDVAVEKVFAATSAGQRVDALYPALAGRMDLVFEPISGDIPAGIDVVFLALPSGEAMGLVPGLLGRSTKVIDLGGDFRLPSAELYRTYYRRDHAAPDLLGKAVYGLPELHRSAIAGASFVANPGCYPTSVILALLPALKANCIVPETIVINSLSGVSGAGRSASLELSFSEVNENIRAYKVGSHQHTPEIEMALGEIAGKPVPVTFVPHLIPITRGIYTTVTATLNVAVTGAELTALYENTFADEPFVRVKQQIPQIRDVVQTNFCDIAVTVETRTRRVIISSVIDNLVKGAAGQAIQNMNLMFGIQETQGL